ncbi:MAG TPA: hypothetical protein VLY21_01520 [Nitrososphaerales archaeon]|nr:hypothetical protein [Nitrososphaerales archaeon]
MAEILEYALVFLVSTLVASFSIGFYSTYTTAVAGSVQRADFSSLVGAAMAAVERGNSSVTLSLDDASVSCSAGLLSYASVSYQGNSTIPTGCNFTDDHVSGTRTLTFIATGGSLRLAVR